ncbi:MAG: DnaB-like helicase C-terminal domain-containing protein [Spirochaetaceae bacterium]|nr:DnaB-like helicase C-terminal domain-containing protein [Spirochaetaceae bacterium]
MENDFLSVSEIVHKTAENVLTGKIFNSEDCIAVNEKLSFYKGELVILASRPSIGKSALALSMAREVALDSKVPVGFCSLGELNRKRLGMRLLAQVAEIDYGKIESCTLDAEETESLKLGADKLSDAPIFISNETAISIDRLENIIKSMVEKQHIQAVFIDCLEDTGEVNEITEDVICNVSGDVTDRYRIVVSDILDQLKRVAEDLHIAVILLMRIFRSTSGALPSMRSFKGLSNIVRSKADMILLLSRFRVPSTVFESDFNIIIPKNRSGKTNLIFGNYLSPYMRFDFRL